MIAYDHHKLEEILGGEIEPFSEDDRLSRMAARAITDSVGSSHPCAQTRFNNARCWFAHMQNVSYDSGVKDEHHRRDQQLKKVLGMKS